MKAKKSLGQNFLKSSSAVRDIVRAGDVVSGDIVLEIGPGLGVLTQELLNAGAKVIAIEKDDRLVIPLSERFSKEIKEGRFVLIHADVLDLVEETGISSSLLKLLGQRYKLIANIPYYITGEIIRRFHTVPQNPSCMVLLVQKEVAERILARDGKESILSISVKMYGNPVYVKTVPRGAFNPAPNVDSAILAIKDIQHFGSLKAEYDFFEILHAAFSHKRKFVFSNLKILAQNLYTRAEKSLSDSNVSSNARAEDLSIAIWQKMIQ